MSISVSFADASTPGPSGPITAWAWDFGDGGTSTSQNPAHDFAAAGTYTVTLTVTGTSPDGTSVTSQTFPVTDPSMLISQFTHTESSLAATFTDTSIAGPSGPITGWAWTFGDGATSTSQNPSHTYSTGGTYNVTLTVTGTSPDGTSSVTWAVTVTASPPAVSYRPYLATSAINKKIPVGIPLHPDSALMISNANHWAGTGTWLGPRARPTYQRIDTSTLPTITMYANNNGWIGAGPYTMHMPTWAASVIGPTSQTGDSHLVLVDSGTGDVWECWHVTPPGYTPRDSGFPSTRWNCSAYRHWAADTTTKLGYGTPSTSYVPGTTASQIHIACGLMVPEDFADCFSGSDPGTVMPHALRTSNFCGSNGTAHPKVVLPAHGGGDGRQPEGIPTGARWQLDPAIDVTTWPSVVSLREPWRSGMKKMLRTMQQYGIVQTDSTGGIGAGLVECARAESVIHGGDNYPVGFKYPNEVAGYGWGVANGVPGDLMAHFRVPDWNHLPT